MLLAGLKLQECYKISEWARISETAVEESKSYNKGKVKVVFCKICDQHPCYSDTGWGAVSNILCKSATGWGKMGVIHIYIYIYVNVIFARSFSFFLHQITNYISS